MSTPYELAPLNVIWSMPDPPLPARDFFPWPEINLGEAVDLEIRLGWPGGSLAILHEAFQRQLSRINGWQIPPELPLSPFQVAAKVFRRGVALKDQKVEQKQGQYPIRFVPTLLWEELAPVDQICIIDQSVAIAHQLKPTPNRIFIQLDELNKNLASVAAIQDAVQRTGLRTPWTIIGGGILADTAAFTAALTGQSFRLIPTTLLAMVDACIGGKTGVNFPPFGKNQLGLFAFPKEVIIATDWLTTLPPREFLAGLAEAWKHAILKGDAHFAEKVAQLDRRPQDLFLYLRELVAVKSEIVAQDPTEQGLRACLNLGHTLAHAIERISQNRNPQQAILHGEAVGVGLLFCIDLSHSLGHLGDSAWKSMVQQLLNSKIVITHQQLQSFMGTENLGGGDVIEELLVGIRQDKKNSQAHSSEWVLLKDWGEPLQLDGRYTITLQDETLRQCYKSFVRRWQQSEFFLDKA